MINWYQHIPENIHPIVFTIGFFALYWYSLMYMVSLGVSGLILWRLVKDFLTLNQYIDLVSNLVAGILIGSRLGYVLLYNLSFYATHPMAIIWPFDTQTGDFIGIAGMSYYGGLLGVVIGLWLFIRQYKLSFWRVADAIALSVPIGYFFGRIGNFLNGELYGRVTQKAWGMYVSDSFGDILLRHPSQVYEAFFEGVVLFFVLLIFRKRYCFPGALAAVYIGGYSFFRLCVEFFREPDAQIGFLFGWITLGQILAVAVCIISGRLFFWLKQKKYDTIKK